MSCLYKRFRKLPLQFRIQSLLSVAVFALIFLNGVDLNAQNKLYDNVSVQLERVDWVGLNCADGTDVGLGCVSIAGGPDPRFRYQVAGGPFRYIGNSVGPTNGIALDNQSETDGRNISGATYLTSFSNVCRDGISIYMQAWEEDQSVAGVALCPESVDYTYDATLVGGCVGTADDLSGFGDDFQANTTNNYDLPSGGNLGDAASTGTRTVSFGNYSMRFRYTWDKLNAPIISPASPEACIGATIQLTSSAPIYGANNIEWFTDQNDPSGSSLGFGTTINVVVPSVPFTLYAAEENSNCYGVFRQITINQAPAPNQPTAAGAQTCLGGSVTLSASSTSPGANFIWYDANPNTTGVLVGTGPDYTTPPINLPSEDWWVIATYGVGCESAPTQVTVTTDLPLIAPNASSVTICEGYQVDLSATSGGANSGFFNWYSDAGLTNLLYVGNPYTTPNLSSSTTYYVTEDIDDCVTPSTAVVVTVTPSPGVPDPDQDTVFTIIGGTATYSVSAPLGPNQVYRWYAENPLLGGPILFEGSTWTSPPINVPIEDFFVIIADTTVDCSVGNLKLDGSGSRVINSGSARVVAVAASLIDPPVTVNDTICSGSTATLTATPDSAGAVIVWFSSGSPVDSIATGNTYTTPPLAQNTTYYAGEYINGELVSELAAVTAVVNAKPVTPSAANSLTYCDINTPDILEISVSPDNIGDFLNVDFVDVTLGDTTESIALLSITSSTVIFSWIGAGPSTAGEYTFIWTVTDANGCESDPDFTYVTLEDQAVAPTVNNPIICAGESTVLTATGNSGTNSPIEWYSDAGLTDLLFIGSTFTTGVLTSDTAFFAIEAMESCNSLVATATVTISALPSAPTTTNDTICQGDVATLAASGSGGTLIWFSDASAIDSIGTGTSFTTGALYQSTTYYVGEESAGGCLGGLAAVTAYVNPKPTPVNAPTQVTQCTFQPVIVNFLDEQLGSFLHFIAIEDATGDTVANFIDPIFALSQDIVGFFIAADEQTLVLSVIDPVTGCESDVTIMNVSIIDPPPAPTVNGDTVICASESTVLTAAGTGGLITWYEDAGLTQVVSTGGQLNTGALYQDTTFYVTETNIDVTTCESEATVVNITVNSLQAGPTVTNDSICEGETATLMASGSGGTLIWYSDAGGNDSIGTGTSYTTTALTQTTTYYVGEESAGAECPSQLVAVYAVVNPKPATPSFNTNSLIICKDSDLGEIEVSISSDQVGDTLHLILVRPDLSIVEADFLINSIPFTVVFAVTANAQLGLNHVYSTVISSTSGCESDVAIATVIIIAPPAAPTANGDVVCVGEDAILTASGNGGHITWYADTNALGLGINVLSTGSQFNPGNLTGDTTFFVTETDIDVSNCESEVTAVSVTVNGVPNAPTVTNDTICEGETATLMASGSGGTLIWYSDPSGIDSVGTGDTYETPVLTHTTIYYVAEVNASGCEGGLTPVTAVVNPIPSMPTGAPVIVVCNDGSTVEDVYFVNTENVGDFGHIITITPVGDTLQDVVFEITEISIDLDWLNLVPSGDYLVVFTVIDAVTGCESDPAITLVQVQDLPDAPTVLDTVEICSGETATLFAYGQVANPNSVITWYDNPNFDPLAYGWEYETQPLTADKTFYATITNEDGCESEPSVIVVIVNDLPADPVGTNDTICQWTSATLTATGNGGLLTWYSDGAGTNVVGTGSSYPTPVLAQTTVFYVGETNTTTGCESSLVGVTAVVIPGPDAPQAANITLCVDEVGEITATGSGTGSLIWYDANQVQIEVDAMPPATGSLTVGPFATAGTYFFYVSENDGNCESQLEEIEVVVGEALFAPVAEGDTICEGETATITAIGTGGVINWYADGALTIPLSSGSQYTTDVLTATTSFWATESFGSCEGPAVEVEVVVNPLPATPTASSNAPICEGETLTLFASSVFGATYEWTGPNGFTSNLQNPTIDNVTEANNQGIYSVVVTSNSSGCQSGTASVYVEIVPIPDAPSIASNSPLCEGEDLVLTASVVAGATYTWYDGSNNVITTTADNSLTIPTVSLADAGTYGVSVNVGGCESPTNTTVVVVKARPDAPAVSNNGPICEYEDLVLIAQIVSGATYTWTGPNGPISQNGPIITISEASVDDAGTYGVFITVNGCSSDSATTEVEITAAPVLPQNPTTNSPVCEHDMLILQAPYDEDLSYDWTGPNGYVADTTFIDTVNNFYVEAVFDANENDHQGFYTLVVTDVNTGCESKPYPVLVIINKYPDNIIADNNGPACEGDNVQLTVTSIVNATYTWTGPLNYVSYEQNPVLENVTPDMSGTYEVTIMLGGCSSVTVSTDVLIRANPIADAGVDLYIEEGTVFQLDGNGSIGAIDFAWLGEDQSWFDNPTSPNPWIGLNGPLPARDEPYVFVLTVYNEFGCTDVDTVLVFVYETTDLIIPNIITPNGDGVNDTWVVQYLDNLDNYVLSIYARGGTLVYKTSAYNDDWDGTMDGDDLPEGTYWYTIRSDDELVFKGYIEIIR